MHKYIVRCENRIERYNDVDCNRMTINELGHAARGAQLVKVITICFHILLFCAMTEGPAG